MKPVRRAIRKACRFTLIELLVVIAVIGILVTPGGQALSGVTAIESGAFHTVVLFDTVSLLPSLQVRANGNELILSWPMNAVGLTLQSPADLAPSVTWVDYSNPPAALGAQFTVTNSVSGAAQYFRLLKR